MARSRKPSPARKKIADLSPDYKRRQQNAARKAGMSLSEFRRSKTRLAAARGHKDEKTERKRRSDRTRAQYGVGPDTLRRLRREALAHRLQALDTAGASSRINVETVEQGIKTMSRDALNRTRGLSWDQMHELAGLSYAKLVERYPEYENDDKKNPLWYK